MHVAKINEKGHEFEKCERYFEQFRMRKKEGRNVLIILGRKINETINEKGDHKLERMSGEICFE